MGQNPTAKGQGSSCGQAVQRTPSPKHTPGSIPLPLATHLCPVLQPLVELKYPVVSLVPVRRVPPAQGAEQAVRGRSSHGVGKGPKPAAGGCTAPPGFPRVQTTSATNSSQQCAGPTEAPRHRSMSSHPSRVPDRPLCLPNARLQVCWWVHGSRSRGRKKSQISASGGLPLCLPQLLLPGLRQQEVRLAGCEIPHMVQAAP